MITDINNKTNQNTRNNIIECPICLEELYNNNDDAGIIIVDCCNKKFHIKCIVTWYSHNINNNFCLMCNQPNSFCDNLLSDISYITDNYDNIDYNNIDISDHTEIVNDVAVDISNLYNNNITNIQLYREDLPLYLYNRNNILFKCKVIFLILISAIIMSVSIYYIINLFLYEI